MIAASIADLLFYCCEPEPWLNFTTVKRNITLYKKNIYRYLDDIFSVTIQNYFLNI